MIKLLIYSLIALLGIAIVLFILPTGKFLKDKRMEKEQWENRQSNRIDNIGAVKTLKILPLVDYYTLNDEFTGETGVSYLVEADGNKILFDLGYNFKNEHPSPLLKNMEKLGIGKDDIDSIFITHAHADHVGGWQANKGKDIPSYTGRY